YEFPSDVTGVGETIAILEFGGGFNYPDLNAYFAGVGVREPNVTAISVDGAVNSPGGRADIEVLLDIQVAGAIANGAEIDVYFAPNTDQGFVDAILDAIHNTSRPSAISISWGAEEESWTPQAVAAVNQALHDASLLGIPVIVSAGDSGSSDGQG